MLCYYIYYRWKPTPVYVVFVYALDNVYVLGEHQP